MPNNTPLGIPWNCAANSWNTAGPLSWYNTRTRGPPSRSPPWNPADSRRPCLVKPGLQDSIYLAPAVRNHIRTIRYPKCVCIALLKRQKTSYVLVFLSENSYISQCLVGYHICTKPVFKVCVCARHILKDGITPQCSCVFQRTVYCPLAFVLSFPENNSIPVPYKGKSVILLLFAQTLFLTDKKPTSRLTSFKKN